MLLAVHPGQPAGTVDVPASKSHTIRALLIASFARGRSVIERPLDSADTRSCIRLCRALGAKVIERVQGGALTAIDIEGTGGEINPPTEAIDCGNSGTTLYLACGLAALGTHAATFTGDDQLRNRTVGPLVSALEQLGARCKWLGKPGYPPFTIGGPLTPGSTSVRASTSQYLSALLLAVPLISPSVGSAGHAVTQIDVPLLNERPYVAITLHWLDRQAITYERNSLESFSIEAGQRYRGFERTIPGDYSSATFFMVAAAVSGATIRLRNLDPEDPQGDRRMLELLSELGCDVQRGADGVEIHGPPEGRLDGGVIDINDMPDALPALAVAGTRCAKPLELANVPQAREKETDRIAVMAGELGKLGVVCEERPAGIIIHPSPIRSGIVDSHGDHRVAMALAIAAIVADGPVRIDRAECARITYPGFFDALSELGIQVGE